MSPIWQHVFESFLDKLFLLLATLAVGLVLNWWIGKKLEAHRRQHATALEANKAQMQAMLRQVRHVAWFSTVAERVCLRRRDLGLKPGQPLPEDPTGFYFGSLDLRKAAREAQIDFGSDFLLLPTPFAVACRAATDLVGEQLRAESRGDPLPLGFRTTWRAHVDVMLSYIPALEPLDPDKLLSGPLNLPDLTTSQGERAPEPKKSGT